MKKYTYRAAAFAIMSMFAVGSFAKPWEPASDPTLISANAETRFAQLPLASTLSGPNQPWPDTWWPSNQGGIAAPYRTDENAWTNADNLPAREDLLAGAVSAETINNLPATAKFDLLRRKYDYPLTYQVLDENSPEAKDWEGICHGWASAAINLGEPQPITVRNADGLEIHFGSSDVKALLAYFYGVYAYDYLVEHSLGERCDTKFLGRILDNHCKRDINAGAFHIALANLIGIQHRALIGDVTQTSEVWNQPIVGYVTEVLREREPGIFSGASSGTVKQMLVRTRMTYVDDVEPQEDPLVSTGGQNLADRTYTYWLDLDAAGKIIGGKWKDGQSDLTPDFLWTVDRMPFYGDFKLLGKIYVSPSKSGAARAPELDQNELSGPGIRSQRPETKSKRK